MFQAAPGYGDRRVSIPRLLSSSPRNPFFVRGGIHRFQTRDYRTCDRGRASRLFGSVAERGFRPSREKALPCRRVRRVGTDTGLPVSVFGCAEGAELLEETAEAENQEALAILARGLLAPDFARAEDGRHRPDLPGRVLPGEHQA